MGAGPSRIDGPNRSAFARGLTTETAFDVLAVARRLQAAGKDVIALQIGDSPFPSTSSAVAAAHAAIDAGLTHYCPSLGLTEFRETIARTVRAEFGIEATADNAAARTDLGCNEVPPLIWWFDRPGRRQFCPRPRGQICTISAAPAVDSSPRAPVRQLPDALPCSAQRSAVADPPGRRRGLGS